MEILDIIASGFIMIVIGSFGIILVNVFLLQEEIVPITQYDVPVADNDYNDNFKQNQNGYLDETTGKYVRSPEREKQYIESKKVYTTQNRQWAEIPIKYAIIEVNSSNGGKYICPDNEKERIRKATEVLTNATDKDISFVEVKEEDADMKFQCLGRKPINSFYEEGGNVLYDKGSALITIRNANDPYRNCLDVELHEILHTFGYDDIIYNDNNVNDVMVTRDSRQCANLPDLSKIKEEYGI